MDNQQPLNGPLMGFFNVGGAATPSSNSESGSPSQQQLEPEEQTPPELEDGEINETPTPDSDQDSPSPRLEPEVRTRPEINSTQMFNLIYQELQLVKYLAADSWVSAMLS